MQSGFPTHLRQKQTDELRRVIKHIKESIKPEKIILFGSYARGDFVEFDKRNVFGYTETYESDFDILVLTIKEEHDKNKTTWNTIEDKIRRDQNISTPVSLIHDFIGYMNTQLETGSSFYGDIKKEGILLYDRGKIPFSKRKDIPKEEYAKLIEERKQNWIRKAQTAYRHFQVSLSDAEHAEGNVQAVIDNLNMAAFMLHQMAESVYMALWILLFDYKPKMHDLGKLSEKVEKTDKRLAVFGKRLKKNREIFTLLKKAYIEARYNPEYRISKEQLLFLESRVKKLLARAKKITFQ